MTHNLCGTRDKISEPKIFTKKVTKENFQKRDSVQKFDCMIKY